MKYKNRIWGLAVLMTPVMGLSQSPPTVSDQDLINLTTPRVLDLSTSLADIELRSFGGDDGLLRGGFAVRHGIGYGLEADIRADFAAWGTNNNVKYGGSDGEVTLKYALPDVRDASLQAGFAYADTPAQDRRFATVYGGTIGTKVGDLGRVYFNPRGILLQSNGIVGLGVGFEANLVPGIHLIGEWTPVVSGDNSIDPNAGDSRRIQLYGAALRFSNVFKGSSLDLGYTNAAGQTTGMGLTPGLGNTGAIYARLTARF